MVQVVLQEELAETTALLDWTMGEAVTGAGKGTMRRHIPFHLPLCISKSLHNEKLSFFLLTLGQQCFLVPTCHSTCHQYLKSRVALVFFRMGLLAFAPLITIAIIFDNKPL